MLSFIKKIALTVAVNFLAMSGAMAHSIEGNWRTVDDKTGKQRAVVQLSITKGVLSGKIVQIVKQEGDTGICSRCPGKFKDKPVKGLNFVWGLTQKGENSWEGGNILDPKTGKIYRAQMTLKGDKLYVRGYMGVSLLGRTQIWVR